jgi:type IV pilus assembly protein PilC
MIGVGEQTGHLEDTLLYLADFYEEEIDNISKNLNTILEPFLLLFIGLIVAFVALAVISPIYQLTGSIRR